MKVPKVKPVVGMISYLPDKEEVREERIKRLTSLLTQIDNLLNIPIMIIAQNWKDFELKPGIVKKNVYLYKYDTPLGIVGARKALREKFLSSQFDYLVMLDDDSVLSGTPEGGKCYLNQLNNKKYGWGEYRPQLLKLFAISKEMFKNIDYPDGGADGEDSNRRFFEDALLIQALKKHYPQNNLNFKIYKEFNEASDSAWDKFNTGWHDEVYNDEWNRHDTGDLTRYLVWNSTLDNNGTIVFHFPSSRDQVERGTTWSGEKRLVYDNKYKVSIIIPVYNGEKYITNCLNSIPNMKDLEVIVIDDGSTDGTLEILKHYDQIINFSAYHQENKGPGMARNAGLDVAKGKYIYFLDSDDELYTNNFIAMMTEGFKQVDRYDPDILTALRQDNTLDSEGKPHSYYPGTFQGRFVKRELIADTRHNDKQCHEDMDFMKEVEAKPHSELRINLLLYHYNFPRVGSQTDLYNHDMAYRYSKKMGKAIGIISYFPDGELGQKRREACFRLLTQINDKLKLPTYIVAQNWTSEDITVLNDLTNQHFTILKYNEPIGIASARIKLREELLKSDYDYFIFLDDDMMLNEDQSKVDHYLNNICIDYDFYYIDNFLINGACISKEGLNKIPFDNLDPAKGEGFEDWLWAEKCKRLLRSKNVGPSLIQGTRHDYLTKYQECYSTWNGKDMELERINTEKTRELIAKIGK